MMEVSEAQRKALVLAYLSAKAKESRHLDALNEVLKACNPDSQLFGLTPDYVSKVLDSALLLLFTQDQMSWMEWWIYEVNGKAKVSDETGAVTLKTDDEFYAFFMEEFSAKEIEQKRTMK